jgi:DNA-binding NtrC family response regulator
MLVIDDEPAIRFALRGYFTPRGFDVALASDFAGAALLLGSRRFDLLIADLRLSSSDDEAGLRVVSHARRVAPTTRIIVLTAYGTADSQRRALAEGASAFLHKPTPLSELAQTVLSILAEHEPRERTERVKE